LRSLNDPGAFWNGARLVQGELRMPRVGARQPGGVRVSGGVQPARWRPWNQAFEGKATGGRESKRQYVK